jgi:hypothetical protein
MRPNTLSEAAERIAGGVPAAKALGELLDVFYGAASGEERLAAIRDEPPPTGDEKLDAVLGAAAEYLAKLYRLSEVPAWAGGPKRRLSKPYFTTTSHSPGMREYLTFSSPAEFRWRNIFTEERPLRRARSDQALRAVLADEAVIRAGISGPRNPSKTPTLPPIMRP